MARKSGQNYSRIVYLSHQPGFSGCIDSTWKDMGNCKRLKVTLRAGRRREGLDRGREPRPGEHGLGGCCECGFTWEVRVYGSPGVEAGSGREVHHVQVQRELPGPRLRRGLKEASHLAHDEFLPVDEDTVRREGRQLPDDRRRAWTMLAEARNRPLLPSHDAGKILVE